MIYILGTHPISGPVDRNTCQRDFALALTVRDQSDSAFTNSMRKLARYLSDCAPPDQEIGHSGKSGAVQTDNGAPSGKRLGKSILSVDAFGVVQ